ncbi:MAG TPA: hypothetical protein VKZ18_25645 [Polyangia bacterium]|nr:hypothetical protein [Polyangia bacterium]
MNVANTFKSGLLPRLQENRGLRLVVLVLSAGLFLFAMRLAWLAFTCPLELEMREGSTWMLVLARRAGVDIYDTSRVAFVNMNHGPLDPILKTWISRCLPGLPGHMVIRTFVLLTPLVLFAAAYRISRRDAAAALLAAGTMFLFICHMSILILVGRPDATAICALAVCAVLAHRLIVTPQSDRRQRSYRLTQLGLGAMSSAIFLMSSRYFPVAAALQVVVVVAQLADADGQREPAPGRLLARVGTALETLLLSTGLYLAGFAVVWVSVFLFELHGDLGSYYRHFFGFFSAKSGWGTFQGPAFQLLPSELVETRRDGLLFVLALLVAGLYRLRKRPGQLGAWLVTLSALWGAVAYGYFKNKGGGGLHYFVEFFVFAWIFVVLVFCGRARGGALSQLLLLGIVALVLPWKSLVAQQETLRDLRTRGRIFRRQVAAVTKGEHVFGEETHLFKTAYDNEVIDTGDTAAVIAGSGYFGPAFSRTYQAYTQALISNPPRFVMVGLLDETNFWGITTPTLRDVLRQRYSIRLIARGISLYNGSAQALMERRD